MKNSYFNEFPKHLYHKELPSLIAHNATEEKQARDKGYGDTYVPQKYPKHVGDRIVNNEAEEKAAVAASSPPPAK